MNHTYFKIYDGGSDRDELLISMTGGNSITSPAKSLGNQLFIDFILLNGYEFGKGFTAKITFGKTVLPVIVTTV